MTGTVVYKPLTSICAGERVARDLHDEQGSVVVAAGTAVDDRICRRLQVFGVESVPVTGADVPQTQRGADDPLDHALDHLFRHWRFSPGMNHLRSLIANHRREVTSR